MKVRSATISLEELHLPFIPVVTPIDLWNHDMGLPDSPHVELMRIMLEHGPDWSKVKGSRYVQERQHRFDVGMKRWTKEYIKFHVLEKRWAILKSLKKSGYRSEKAGDRPVRVVLEPFWTTRFGFKHDWLHGMEEVDGGGRCSAAYALGWKEIPAVICEDRAPGTGDKGKFEKKLEGVSGVWDGYTATCNATN